MLSMALYTLKICSLGMKFDSFMHIKLPVFMLFSVVSYTMLLMVKIKPFNFDFFLFLKLLNSGKCTSDC